MEESRQRRIAYLTAGAGGMFCGSCMHDNTLAKALIGQGVDVQLIPLYTPIRTDEDDVSVDRVFLGGINVFLQQKIALFRYLPSFLDRVFDQSWLLKWAATKGMKTSAKELGALTVSVLKGDAGFQRKEVGRLCDWLGREARPDLVNFSNMMIAGCIPAIKQELPVPAVVTLQGDDIFLRDLPEPYQSRAFDEIRRLVEHVDLFVVNSHYYGDFMSEYMSIPADKIRIVPLGLDTKDFIAVSGQDGPDAAGKQRRVSHRTIGYLARLAPEKGLHLLVDAFVALRGRAGTEDVRLKVAGWLGENNREYATREFAKIRDAGLEDAFEYVGEVDRSGKIDFLRSIDLLSVPTTYHEPKGLFVLEALAAGVPVVQPNHGAFPEMIEALQGGRLVRPDDSDALANALSELLANDVGRLELGKRGRAKVLQEFDATAMATRTLDVFKELWGE